MATASYTCPKCGETLSAEDKQLSIATKKLSRKKEHHRKKTCPERFKDKAPAMAGEE